MSSNLSETTMDLARLEAELLAEEAKATEQLKKKREALPRAREEAARKAREEAERKAREEAERKAREEQEQRARAEEQAWREAKLVETIRRAQEEERELHGKCLLISLEAATNFLVGLDANACPEEDGDYVSDGAMDVEEDAAMQGKGKEKEKPLVKRFGAARCSTCVNTDSRCQVDLAVVEKWKGDVACGVKVTQTPAGAACAVCAGKKQKCFLPELAKERTGLAPAPKRKRGEEKKASGSKQAGTSGEGTTESPKKKKTKVEVVVPPRQEQAPRVELEDKDEEQGEDITGALLAIANRVAALVRATRALNEIAARLAESLAVIADYCKRREYLEEEDTGSEGEWASGDKEVVHRADK